MKIKFQFRIIRIDFIIGLNLLFTLIKIKYLVSIYTPVFLSNHLQIRYFPRHFSFLSVKFFKNVIEFGNKMVESQKKCLPQTFG